MNVASMICDNDKSLKSTSFAEECIWLCYYENRQKIVKDGLKQNTQDISGITRRHHI